MGREIRRVPPNWDHPKQEGWSDGRMQPMYDQTFEQAAAEWKDGFAAWERGEPVPFLPGAPRWTLTLKPSP